MRSWMPMLVAVTVGLFAGAGRVAAADDGPDASADAVAGPSRSPTFEVRLTSLDWPPFSGADLPRGGATGAVVEEAFRRANRTLSITFFPWQRAVETGLRHIQYVGYFPEYFSARLAEESCAFSQSVGASPLGFVESVDAPVSWDRLEDLKGTRIGIVQGYVNTEAFDRLVATGELEVDPAIDDAANLRKVAGGRLRLAVIDRNVMDYLLSRDPNLRKVRDRLAFNGRILEMKQLHVCFRRDARGQAIRDAFDMALQTLDVAAIQDSYFKDLTAPGQ